MSVAMEKIIISAFIIILLYHRSSNVVVVVNRITIQPKAGSAAYHTRGFLFVQKQVYSMFSSLPTFHFLFRNRCCASRASPFKYTLTLFTFTFYIQWDILDGVS